MSSVAAGGEGDPRGAFWMAPLPRQDEEDPAEMDRLARQCMKEHRDHKVRSAVERLAHQREQQDEELQELSRRAEQTALYPAEVTAAALRARREEVRAGAERTVRHDEWVREQRARIAALRRGGEDALSAAQREELQEREAALLEDRVTRLTQRITQRAHDLTGSEPPEPLPPPPIFTSVGVLHAATLAAERYGLAVASSLRLRYPTMTVRVLSAEPGASGGVATEARRDGGLFDRIIDGILDCGIIVETSGLASSTADAEDEWAGIRVVSAQDAADVRRSRKVNDANVAVVGTARASESVACDIAVCLVSTATDPSPFHRS